MSQTKHPGKTKAQRAALDAIGCGNFSPPMATSTKTALLSAGLIVKCGQTIYGSGAFAVCIDQYQMPVPVHMQWCEYQAKNYEEEP